MQPKPSKYDTNPLDESVADRATDAFSANSHTATEPINDRRTQEIQATAKATRRDAIESEAPTRRIDEPAPYPSIFVPPKARETVYETPRLPVENIYQTPTVPPPSVYQPPPSLAYPTGSRTVAGLGIPEKWAVTLAYLPFFLAIAITIVELLLVPRTETRTRFHASQALVLHVGITALSTLLTIAGIVSGRFTGASLVNLASFVFLIVAMIRVWKGKPLAILLLDEPRKWIEEKIKPRKQ